MQRRAAAIYCAFFVVMAVGAYSVIALADQPAVDVDGPTYENNTNFSVGGQEYHVTGLGSGGGGGGEAGGSAASGSLVWTNQSAQFQTELSNNSTVEFRNGQYRVFIANESNVNEFTLTEEFNVSQMLQNDSAVYNETVTIEGERRVVYRENGSTQPLPDYLPAPEEESYSEGDRVQYQGNGTTVDNVTSERALLVWTGSKTNEESLEEGMNITLADGNQYVVHFTNPQEVQLSSDVAGYQNELRAQGTFGERKNGLWMVIYISSLAAILIISLAYLPVRG